MGLIKNISPYFATATTAAGSLLNPLHRSLRSPSSTLMFIDTRELLITITTTGITIQLIRFKP